MLQNGMSEDEVFAELGKLKDPLPPQKISWRMKTASPKDYKRQNVPANGSVRVGILLMPYIDARVMMDVLDDVIGPQNWQCEYRELDNKIICRIGIKINGEWIWKEDGAGSSDEASDDDVRGEMSKRDTGKGDLTVAFRRAAQAAWGIGRYLYGFPAPWVDGTWDGKKLKYENPTLGKDGVPVQNRPPRNEPPKKEPPAPKAPPKRNGKTAKSKEPAPKREANDNQDGLTKAMLDVVIPDNTGAPVKGVTFASLVEKWNCPEDDENYKEGDKEFVEVVIGYLAGVKKSPMGKEFSPTDGQADIKMAAQYIWKHVLGYGVE